MSNKIIQCAPEGIYNDESAELNWFIHSIQSNATIVVNSLVDYMGMHHMNADTGKYSFGQIDSSQDLTLAIEKLYVLFDLLYEAGIAPAPKGEFAEKINDEVRKSHEMFNQQIEEVFKRYNNEVEECADHFKEVEGMTINNEQ